MAIGVTYDQFWHDDPQIVRFAIEANEETQKRDAILSDIAAWNTGRYVMVGVGVVLSQAFSRSSTAKYPSEPMLAYELDARLAEQKRERELIQQRDGFLAVAAALARQHPTGENTA
jgi:hypothetical protein